MSTVFDPAMPEIHPEPTEPTKQGDAETNSNKPAGRGPRTDTNKPAGRLFGQQEEESPHD